jgi:hypothetical protein
MAGLSGYLYPAKETLGDPLIAKPGDRSAGSPEESGIEVEEAGANGYRGSERDALTNSTTFGGKDSSTSSSGSQSGSMSSNSEITLSGENNHALIQK